MVPAFSSSSDPGAVSFARAGKLREQLEELHDKNQRLRGILEDARLEPERFDKNAREAHEIYLWISKFVDSNAKELNRLRWGRRDLGLFEKKRTRVADHGSTYREMRKRRPHAIAGLQAPRRRYIDALKEFVDAVWVGLQQVSD